MALSEAVTVAGLLGDAGTIAGIVAALAAAVLAAVVLGQGREIKRLRDELDEESDRARRAEASLTAELAGSRAVPVASPAAVAGSVPLAASGPAIAVEPAPSGPGDASVSSVASAGMPSLGSATAAPSIASQVVAPRLLHQAVPERQAPVPVVDAPRTAPIVIPAPAKAATPAAATVGTGVPLGGPSTAAAGGISRAPRPPAQPAARRRSVMPRAIAGFVLLAAIIFGVVWFAGGGSDSPKEKTVTTQPGKNGTGAIVAVLNGTPVSGLAGQVSRELVRDGFKAGRVATARDQQQSRTVVAYMPGHLTDGEAVVQSLGLKAAPVPADDPTQAIACPDPATCNVEVIVTVGADRTR